VTGGGVTGMGRILVIDTATTRAMIALGDPDGAVVGQRAWVAGYRHGEELLGRIEGLLADMGQEPAALGGIVVGTGPGAFTGLRVGIATAKGLAHALHLPIAGVATGAGLLAAAASAVADPATAADVSAADVTAADVTAADVTATDAARAGIPAPHGSFALLQPAGLSDRILSRPGVAPVILPGGTEPDLGPGERLVAVDLDGRAPVEASALGAQACDGLVAALLAIGAARFTAGDPDDLAELVPEYVTLPRGVRAALPDSAVDVTGGGPRP
jgi:tRNA threonylcarbamoyl adenosine modification protein YeaZ